MPPRAPQLTVRDRLQSDVFLAFDDTLDLGVLDPGERAVVDLAARMLRARGFESLWAEQAADMIGAKRRCRSLSDLSILLLLTARLRWQCSGAERDTRIDFDMIIALLLLGLPLLRMDVPTRASAFPGSSVAVARYNAAVSRSRG